MVHEELPWRCKDEGLKMGFKNGFFKDAQKLKDLKKYSKEW